MPDATAASVEMRPTILARFCQADARPSHAASEGIRSNGGAPNRFMSTIKLNKHLVFDPPSTAVLSNNSPVQLEGLPGPLAPYQSAGRIEAQRGYPLGALAPDASERSEQVPAAPPGWLPS
jgi:hypothetical protein